MIKFYLQLAGHELKPKEWAWIKARNVATSGANKTVLAQLMRSHKRVALLVVRNPFDRVVSAFRDKLEHLHPKVGYF